MQHQSHRFNAIRYVLAHNFTFAFLKQPNGYLGESRSAHTYINNDVVFEHLVKVAPFVVVVCLVEDTVHESVRKIAQRVNAAARALCFPAGLRRPLQSHLFAALGHVQVVELLFGRLHHFDQLLFVTKIHHLSLNNFVSWLGNFAILN